MRHVPRLPQSPALFIAFSLFAALGSACGPTNYYVREMKIDAEQHLIPVGSKSLSHPAADSYYMFFHTATKLTIVNHFAKQAGSADVRELLYLEADQDRLERTVRTDEIVTGPFGAVVAEKTCFYNRPIENYLSSVKVLIQSANPEIGREIPDPISEAPTHVPPLTSAAIVRLFNADSELVFGSGNYDADGTLGSINHGHIVNADLKPGSSTVLPRAPDFSEIRQASGLPPRFEIEDYLHSKRMPLLGSSSSKEPTFVILVYGFGKLIRLDSLDNGVVISSRYLRPVATEEEKILGPECDEHLQRQQSTGRSTVW